MSENGVAMMSGELRPAIVRMLASDDPGRHEQLINAAYAVKREQVGTQVYLRGLIEFSNRCVKDCYYCGIRRSNPAVRRYMMPAEEIVAAAKLAHQHGMRSIVLQSGERSDAAFVDFVEDVLLRISAATGGSMAITLSLGEQTRVTYAKWRAAGARRYLLRIESSDAAYYAHLHPPGHSHRRRLDCLAALRDEGYQVGSGVLIGTPGQTLEQLADDILFFRDADLDMIGMGPYVVHRATPLGKHADDAPAERERRLRLALRMIAVARLLMPDVNIAAATALQALAPRGRELALLAGANVIMPPMTAPEYREQYQLYDDRPCIDETTTQCAGCLEARIAAVGESIAYGVAGDPLHALRRIGEA